MNVGSNFINGIGNYGIDCRNCIGRIRKDCICRCNLGSNSYSYLYCTQNREIQKNGGTSK